MTKINKKDIKSKITIKVKHFSGFVKEIVFSSIFDVETSKKTAIKQAVAQFATEIELESVEQVTVIRVEKGGANA